MKHLLNTLFVTTQGAYLNKEGESLLVNAEREVKLRIPIHNLGGVVCFGNVMCSPFLLGHCANRNVTVSFLTENGRFLARVSGGVSGNVLLRREQYRRADQEHASVAIARNLLTGKIANARTVLQRGLRDHPEIDPDEAVKAAVTRLARIVYDLQKEHALDTLRGLEGDAGRVYFQELDRLITAQKDHFFLKERNRRPPLDNVNALLSFAYTLLVHDCVGALEAVGLDPQVGFLHRERPGRPSLALDLMEEFRPFLADRLVLSLINLRQVQAKGFIKTATGAVEMTDETRKTVLTAWQKRKQEKITHLFLKEDVAIGILPYLQALLLARYMRGDLDEYPFFAWR